MPAIFEHRHEVKTAEIDIFGHVNNVCYVHWIMDAAVAHAAAQGWTQARHREVGEAWFVRSHTIEYLLPARAGDTVIVTTWVADFRKTTSRRRYELHREADNAIVAKAESNFVYVDLAKGTPRRVPPEVSEAFEIVDQ